MDRYIATELLPPFLFGVGAFSSLGVSIGALFELIRRVTESGLPLSIAVQVLLLRFPEFIAYGFPMSILLSSLMTYSKLSSNSELVALKACGVSVYRMILPTLVVCFFVTGLTFAFNELIVPSANYQAKVLFTRALEDNDPSFREDNILYQEFRQVEDSEGDKKDALARLFYAQEFDGVQMKGLTILDFTQTGLEQVVSARAAEWNPTEKAWDFYDGTIYVVSANGTYRNIVKFDTQRLNLPRTPLDLASKPRDYNEMNIAQSYEYLRLLEQGGRESKIRELRVRIQQKYALPFVCVAFGLVGAALGAQIHRGGQATSFAISIVIIFSYYLLAVICGSVAQLDIISPFLGAWLPNLFGLTAAILLLMRSSR
ncbi:MAG: YjgP/YjgQ family permease [Cyanobacteria bacterium RM1_2_2]|nr:YjgP/YjgQ family permease [Cyanobacteria bacterium RM1_2_2]